jgi:hypothetical protein
MARPTRLIKEELALLIEHEALLLKHERLAATGGTPEEFRAHAVQLASHRLRLSSFVETLRVWMDARRGL